MPENPDYWTTIATVIPVLALTLATVYRTNKWHKLSTFQRRWSAAYGALCVIALAIVEYQALKFLQQRVSDKLAEEISLGVVAGISMNVIALPLLPLALIALHDLNPRVARAKKALRNREKTLKIVTSRYEELQRETDAHISEFRLQAAERIFRDPGLAFDGDGRVRPDILSALPELQAVREFAIIKSDMLDELDIQISGIRRGVKKAQRRHNKELMRRTKTASREGHSRML